MTNVRLKQILVIFFNAIKNPGYEETQGFWLLQASC